jgi:hypothetical protein
MSGGTGVKQQVYSKRIGDVRRALEDAGFVKNGYWEFSKGTQYGRLLVKVKGRKNRTRIRVRHEVKRGENVPSYMETNDVHADQALTDIGNVMDGRYAPKEENELPRIASAPLKTAVAARRIPQFDRKNGYGCVMLGIAVAVDEGLKAAGCDYVEHRIITTQKDVERILRESPSCMDEHLAVLASGKSTRDEVEKAMWTVVPYVYERLKGLC